MTLVLTILTMLVLDGPVGLPPTRRLAEGRATLRGSVVQRRAPALFIVTAYCPCHRCCGPKAQGITASSKRARFGMCAADLSVPFGTVFLVPGYGRAIVEDRGSAIRGRKIDVFFPSHKQALNWGRRHLQVEVHHVE